MKTAIARETAQDRARRARLAPEGAEARKNAAVRTVEEVAEIFGISRARVMQLEYRALRKLRRSPILRQAAIDAGVLPESEVGQ